MIIVRNKSHGENMCLYFQLLGSKNTVKLSKKISPYLQSALLVVPPLTMLNRIHFSEFPISRFPTLLSSLFLGAYLYQCIENSRCQVSVSWKYTVYFRETLTWQHEFSMYWYKCVYPSCKHYCSLMFLIGSMWNFIIIGIGLLYSFY